MNKETVINALPHSEPFLFVDEIEFLSEMEVIGSYTFREDAYFYQGHFKDFPITPGVILIECMAQIGPGCMAMYTLHNEGRKPKFGLFVSNVDIDFLKPVFPGEKVKVVAKRIYYRFDKVKCSVKMTNENEEVVARGTISGMLNLSKK